MNIDSTSTDGDASSDQGHLSPTLPTQSRVQLVESMVPARPPSDDAETISDDADHREPSPAASDEDPPTPFGGRTPESRANPYPTPNASSGSEDGSPFTPKQSLGKKKRKKRRKQKKKASPEPLTFSYRIPLVVNRALHAEPGTRCHSPLYTDAEGTRWRLLVFLNHQHPQYSDLEELRSPRLKLAGAGLTSEMHRQNELRCRYLSLYLELCEFPDQNPEVDGSGYPGPSSLKNPQTDVRNAAFTLTIRHAQWTTAEETVAVIDNNVTADMTRKDDHHCFAQRSSDWGYRMFISLAELERLQGGPNAVNQDVVIDVSIRPTPPHTLGASAVVTPYYHLASYDSKETTGMVGLNNQGATCYMNSLLQTLYHTRLFRKAVYEMPTEADDSVQSVPLALQRTFWALQSQTLAVNTEGLTRSFGWDSYDAFQQHDVQELSRVLVDNIEEKMKNTRSERTIETLLQGATRSYIRCVNVPFCSERKETFYDVQLDVKGCKSIHDSFAKFVEEEMLDGENQYEATGHGKQDAKKGVRFVRFPPVLHMQLKRFEFDYRSNQQVKVNSRYTFPLRLDLGPFMDPPAGATAAPATPYLLHSILIHSGEINGGHYYCFVRLPPRDADGKVVARRPPDTTDDEGSSSEDETDQAPPKNNCDADGWAWYKFDDEVVTKVRPKEALEDAFGGRYGQVGSDDDGDDDAENPPWKRRKSAKRGLECLSGRFKLANAYMLVYVQEQDLATTMGDVSDTDLPGHLQERFRREFIEKARADRFRLEADEHFRVRVLTERHVGNVAADMMSYLHDVVPGVYPTLDRAEKMCDNDTLGQLFSVRKHMTIGEFSRVVQVHCGIPVSRQRLWVVCRDDTDSYRTRYSVQKVVYDGLIDSVYRTHGMEAFEGEGVLEDSQILGDWFDQPLYNVHCTVTRRLHRQRRPSPYRAENILVFDQESHVYHVTLYVEELPEPDAAVGSDVARLLAAEAACADPFALHGQCAPPPAGQKRKRASSTESLLADVPTLQSVADWEARMSRPYEPNSAVQLQVILEADEGLYRPPRALEELPAPSQFAPDPILASFPPNVHFDEGSFQAQVARRREAANPNLVFIKRYEPDADFDHRLRLVKAASYASALQVKTLAHRLMEEFPPPAGAAYAFRLYEIIDLGPQCPSPDDAGVEQLRRMQHASTTMANERWEGVVEFYPAAAEKTLQEMEVASGTLLCFDWVDARQAEATAAVIMSDPAQARNDPTTYCRVQVHCRAILNRVRLDLRDLVTRQSLVPGGLDVDKTVYFSHLLKLIAWCLRWGTAPPCGGPGVDIALQLGGPGLAGLEALSAPRVPAEAGATVGSALDPFGRLPNDALLYNIELYLHNGVQNEPRIKPLKFEDSLLRTVGQLIFSRVIGARRGAHRGGYMLPAGDQLWKLINETEYDRTAPLTLYYRVLPCAQHLLQPHGGNARMFRVAYLNAVGEPLYPPTDAARHGTDLFAVPICMPDEHGVYSIAIRDTDMVNHVKERLRVAFGVKMSEHAWLVHRRQHTLMSVDDLQDIRDRGEGRRDTFIGFQLDTAGDSPVHDSDVFFQAVHCYVPRNRDGPVLTGQTPFYLRIKTSDLLYNFHAKIAHMLQACGSSVGADHFRLCVLSDTLHGGLKVECYLDKPSSRSGYKDAHGHDFETTYKLWNDGNMPVVEVLRRCADTVQSRSVQYHAQPQYGGGQVGVAEAYRDPAGTKSHLGPILIGLERLELNGNYLSTNHPPENNYSVGRGISIR